MDATATNPDRMHYVSRLMADFRVPMTFVVITAMMIVEIAFGRPGILPATSFMASPTGALPACCLACSFAPGPPACSTRESHSRLQVPIRFAVIRSTSARA